jgi:primase-polymerase (primpol)-like protein
MKRYADRQLIQVLWTDSASTDAWMHTADAVEQMKLGAVWTVGWVIHEDEDRVVLAASHFEDWEQVGEVIAIPKAMIRTTVHLRDLDEEPAA